MMALLHPQPDARLGGTGAAAVKAHEFFSTRARQGSDRLGEASAGRAASPLRDKVKAQLQQLVDTGGGSAEELAQQLDEPVESPGLIDMPEVHSGERWTRSVRCDDEKCFVSPE